MKFISTRRQTPPVSLSAAIAAGLAADGGLYVPQSLPSLRPEDFVDCSSLAQIGTRLLAPFFVDDPLAAELPAICHDAFDFPTPLKPLLDTTTLPTSPLPAEGGTQAFPAAPADTYLLELFHGPTAAFKDVGARFLAACLQRLQASAVRELTILVATSGDTGAAVAAACHRLRGLRVVVLYPEGRVSPRQAHQLGCFGDNITALRVAGSFDDCQRLVKQALADTRLQAQLPLSSANSISLGRLLPQMSYYASASLQFWRQHRQALNLVVPTGNLGNALAAMLARAIGLPIGRIVLASNDNRVLADFFAGSAYTPRASLATLANAMDVGDPSNFERLRWLYPDTTKLRAAFTAIPVSDEEIRAAIRDANARFSVAICPHTATAWQALTDMRAHGDTNTWAVVATAHPAKFDSVVEPLLARTLAVPPALAALLARPAHAEPMPADYPAFRQRLAALTSIAPAP